jgi:AraC family transcriptional regulator
MTTRTPENTSYVERINLAIDHVVRHLDEPLPLETVAAVARFSPFHFHRIFRGMMGETLNDFVKRLRLERAVVLLSRPKRQPLTEIALACGFASSSDFSRCFKQRYGVAPSAFDVKARRDRGRKELGESVEVQHPHRLERLPPGQNPDGFEVKLRKLPPRTVAYIRVHDSFRPDAVPAAYARLGAWAEQRGLAGGQWLGYMWDDPEIVELEDCRYDVGLVVPDLAGALVPEGEVGRMQFPAMTVAEIEIRGGIDLEMRAIDWYFGTWLPRSAYVPAEQPNFESWIGRPFAHGMERFELNAQFPLGRA